MARILNNIPEPSNKISEIQLQAAAFQYSWNTYPLTRLCIFHVPNGGSRNAIEGMQLKASGVIAGVPDILMVWLGKTYAFEFKTLTGTVSPQQTAVHIAWANQGIIVKIIRTLEQWKDELKAIIEVN